MKDESRSSDEFMCRDQTEDAPLFASDWLWRPWYAKLWWCTIPLYWGGRMASVKFPVLSSFYDSLLAGYLAIFCNPLIILLLLGFGFVRAKLNRGDWVITPDVPEKMLRPGDLSDPYTDPTDPRSGVRHLRHLGVLKDGSH
ncbi:MULTISPECIES: hypothetical protein [unclassified Sphingomonas]|uniref:hypothetical protein n=1 Tax=unclassified Sphingomonas TaxID=196159 RepID=UPI00285A0C42|nr:MULTISPECIES: hypothetical protein [unclassified Sphingomonas]MDR6116645.1 hypothetical protein [Sphingomonas sp. SORGH_AS_0789]MDR6149678.1 hypothetical protein [Sphingomonas sp. SORGH_AS_0742]